MNDNSVTARAWAEYRERCIALSQGYSDRLAALHAAYAEARAQAEAQMLVEFAMLRHKRDAALRTATTNENEGQT